MLVLFYVGVVDLRDRRSDAVAGAAHAWSRSALARRHDPRRSAKPKPTEAPPEDVGLATVVGAGRVRTHARAGGLLVLGLLVGVIIHAV